MNQTWQNSKKSNFRPDFCSPGTNLGPKIFFRWVKPLVDVSHCRKLSLYPISRKTNDPDPNSRKWRKISFWAWAQIWVAKKNYFFFKNLASSVTRYNGKISSCTISDKTNDPILRKLRDGRTERRADRRTDGKSDFMDAVRPKFSVQQEHLFVKLLII